MFNIKELTFGDMFELYQQNFFDKVNYLYRGKRKYISLYEDNDIIFEDENNDQYIFSLSDINNGFWRFKKWNIEEELIAVFEPTIEGGS